MKTETCLPDAGLRFKCVRAIRSWTISRCGRIVSTVHYAPCFVNFWILNDSRALHRIVGLQCSTFFIEYTILGKEVVGTIGCNSTELRRRRNLRYFRRNHIKWLASSAQFYCRGTGLLLVPENGKQLIRWKLIPMKRGALLLP